MTQTNNSQPWALTLSQTLAGPSPIDMITDAQDIPNVRLEAKDGLWYGHAGDHASMGTVTPLTTTYLALGVTCKVAGVPYSWGGAGVGWSILYQNATNRCTQYVVGLGDSISQFGYGVAQAACMQSGGEFLLIKQLGVAGYVTADIIGDTLSKAIAIKPRIVFLQIGTNNATGAKATALSTYISELSYIIRTLQQDGIKVLYCTFPGNDSAPAIVDKFNTAGALEATRLGCAVYWAWDAITGVDGKFTAASSADGLHPKTSYLPSEGVKALDVMRNAFGSGAPIAVRMNNNGTNLFTNGTLSLVTGDHATGTSVLNGTSSLVAIGRGNKQRCTSTGNSSPVVLFGAYSGISVGKRIFVQFDVEFHNDAANTQGCGMVIQNDTVTRYLMPYSHAMEVLPGETYTGTVCAEYVNTTDNETYQCLMTNAVSGCYLSISNVSVLDLDALSVPSL